MTLSARTRVISALGIVQIFTWGSSFYLLAVLAGPIAADTGWSPAWVTGGISVGLLAAGLAARRIGGLIQAEGGRRVMAAGALLLATGLTLLAMAPNLGVYLAAWLVIGLGMGASLYDAAFSTLGRIYGGEARGAITALTLWGGFASTVCWPISAWLVESLGWRGTCLAYAALHLGLTLPLCLAFLPRVMPEALPEDPETAPPPRAALADIRFWCIAISGTALSVMASIWSVHLMTILTAQGYTLAAAVGLGALIGPSQVGARVVEMAGRSRHHPIWTMAASTLLVAAGFLGLLFDIPAAAALIAYGAGNGLWSIARGALPLSLFGARDYARYMGALATPMLLASAAAPLAGAGLIARLGASGTLMVLALISLLPVAATAILWREIARERHQPPDQPPVAGLR